MHCFLVFYLVRRPKNTLWTLGGLSVWELMTRTLQESWEDSVFGQGGRMAFYHFLAIFPALAVLLAASAHVPRLAGFIQRAGGDLSGQFLPGEVARLFQQILAEMNAQALSGLHFVAACAGALWAALNATWAMIYGLNRAYEIEEHRPWWQLAITIVGLTLALVVLCCVALSLIFASAQGGILARHGINWLAAVAAACAWFAILYRFAPSLADHEWRWSTPGALCALILWVGAAFGAQVYFERVNDYSRAFGHLNGVAMLLLWLYVSNGAILIGGEMNSEIKKASGAEVKA
jgi:membrane protein